MCNMAISSRGKYYCSLVCRDKHKIHTRVILSLDRIESVYPTNNMADSAKILGVSYAILRRNIDYYKLPKKKSRESKIPLLNDVSWLKQELELKSIRQIAKELKTTSGNVADKAYRNHILIPSDKSLSIIKSLKRKYPDGRFGKMAANWRGGHRKLKTGYIYIYKPDHPNATKEGYVMEHRLVLEKKLGRYLKPSEIAHHINGIKDDNRPENISLTIKGEHTKNHFLDSFKTRELEKRVLELEQENSLLKSQLKN